MTVPHQPRSPEGHPYPDVGAADLTGRQTTPPAAFEDSYRNEDLGQPLSSVGDIIGQITEDLSTLVRQETELAKAELKQSATRAGKGAGMFGGAGVAGHMALLFITIAVWWGIAHLIESFGWAALIVGVLWAIVAAVLAAVGRNEFQAVRGMPKTIDTVQQIPDALKGNEDIR